jgi:AcrR family transcriptional regulator
MMTNIPLQLDGKRLRRRKSSGRAAKKKMEKRDAILSAASELFSTRGYDTVRLRDIINRSDLPVGTFYSYFRTKSEIREALIHNATTELRSRLPSLSSEKVSFYDLVRSFVEAYLEIQAKHGMKSFNEALPSRPVFNPLGDSLYRHMHDVILEKIEARHPAARNHADFASAMAVGIINDVGLPILAKVPHSHKAVSALICEMIFKVSRFNQSE